MKLLVDGSYWRWDGRLGGGGGGGSAWNADCCCWYDTGGAGRLGRLFGGGWVESC